MERGFQTRSVHAGQDPDPATGSRAPPIYQTTSFVFEDAGHAADLYALEAEGDVYSRISNPTTRTLERRLASLEGGVGAVATASGMAALDGITTALASAGDNVVAAVDTYGGTATYLTALARRRGVEARTVDTLDYEAYAEAVDDDTAFVHVETVANPSLVTPDFERLADLAHDHAVPLVVDNTFATPALCRPIEHGADVVWESTTKWIHGKGTTVGGVIVDGGTFPWDHPDADYPLVTGDAEGYDLDFVSRFDERALAETVRHRAVRTTGAAQSPFDAWQTLQGLETLPLRMDRHSETAAAVAGFLDDHGSVSWVDYPGLDSHPTHDEASRYLGGSGGDAGAGGSATGPGDDAGAGGPVPDDDAGTGESAGGSGAPATGTPATGYGGMVTFGLAGGYPAAEQFCESVDLASFLANVGDSKTLVIHPASTTHSQLSEEAQREAGVTPDMVRLSVGLEDAGDVLADLEAALSRAAEVGA
ncbi:MAG: O-acetylhomoserine aminocarboxypropyltransferase/cysteine synthase family protein [Haloferacaceae archaeon]